MEGLEPVLTPGWGSVFEERYNVSLGLGSEAAGTLPPNLVAACAERHKLSSAYLHDEYPDRRIVERWRGGRLANRAFSEGNPLNPCAMPKPYVRTAQLRRGRCRGLSARVGFCCLNSQGKSRLVSTWAKVSCNP